MPHPNADFSYPDDLLLPFYPSIADLADRLRAALGENGTPLYVADSKIIADRYQAMAQSLRESWGPYTIGYSFKTNYGVAQHRVLMDQGAWAEVVSAREYQMALDQGYPRNRIIYNGPYKDDASLQLALAGRSLLNINDFDELARVIELADAQAEVCNLGIRVTSDLPRLGLSRFGFSMDNEEAQDAVAQIRQHPQLKLCGIHTHLYGDTDDPEIYGVAAQRVGQFAQQHFADCGETLQYIDVGGGYPAHSPKPKSRDQWQPQPIDVYVAHVSRALSPFFPERDSRPTLIMEPGRYLTCDAIVLITRVVHVKQRFDKQIVVCDGSISMVPLTHYSPQVIRLYTADLSPRETRNRVATSIQGATCRENDSLYEGPFPTVQVGDLLIHFAAGAYNANLAPNFIFSVPKTVFI